MDYATCIDESVYGDALTYGKKYPILAYDSHSARPKIKTQTNTGQIRWLPATCFDLGGTSIPTLHEISIRDDVAEAGSTAIEVEVVLSNGQRRWCVFTTPEALTQFGDILPGTHIRVHYYLSHLIIVSAISEDIIKQTLSYLERHGQLLVCTQAVASNQ